MTLVTGAQGGETGAGAPLPWYKRHHDHWTIKWVAIAVSFVTLIGLGINGMTSAYKYFTGPTQVDRPMLVRGTNAGSDLMEILRLGEADLHQARLKP